MVFFFFFEKKVMVHWRIRAYGSMSLPTKLCFWTRIWVGSLLEINKVPTNYIWKVTFLCSLFQVILVPKLCSAVLCCQDRFLPVQDHTAGMLPATADPWCSTVFGKGPKLSLYFTDYAQSIQTLKHNLAPLQLRRRWVGLSGHFASVF